AWRRTPARCPAASPRWPPAGATGRRRRPAAAPGTRTRRRGRACRRWGRCATATASPRPAGACGDDRWQPCPHGGSRVPVPRPPGGGRRAETPARRPFRRTAGGECPCRAPTPPGGVAVTTLRVWAPRPRSVAAVVDGRAVPARPAGGGWWEAEVGELAPGTRYGWSLDGGPVRPDPRGARLPDGVTGPSAAVDLAAPAWGADRSRAPPLGPWVIYELHVGTFTPEGSLDAAIGRLDHLVELGVTTVEVMPVAAFPGRHGWGYDGVGLYAVHEPYGGPHALQRFVDACHRRGLAVVLDVVYNHLGPSGNHLGEFGPYLTDRAATPWGDAVNLDGPGSDEVRAFLVDNARQWLRDVHVDGLRLDAVQTLHDRSAHPFLAELAEEVAALAASLGRPLVLIAETDANDPRLVEPPEAGGLGLDAMWTDDLHHALHVALTGERGGHHLDFTGAASEVADVLAHGYRYRGRWSPSRGRRHGRPLHPDR